MSKRIILKESGLDNTSNPPSGYKYIGYLGSTFSEKSTSTFSSFGGSTNEYTYEIGEYVESEGGVIFHRYKDGSNENYLVVDKSNIPFLNTSGFELSFDGGDPFVWAMATQSNGKIICVGNFQKYDGLTASGIIRFNVDGTKDETFDNSNGFNASVSSVAVQSDDKIIVGGSFTSYKGSTNNRIIRLNSDGTKDNTFDNSTGFNGQVYGICIQPDGNIVCVGSFTRYKNVTGNNRIIRLSSNGIKDNTFDNSTGFSAFSTPKFVEIQSDGKLLVGGNVFGYKGVTMSGLVRIETTGSLDLSFDTSIGFYNEPKVVKIQSDGKIIVGGAFYAYKGLTESGIIRLNSDSSKDSSFNNDIGFNGNRAYTLCLQSDDKIIVGGQFSEYKGVSASCIIRLNSDGTKDETFDTSVGFTESEGQFTLPSVWSIITQPSGGIFAGGIFTEYKGVSSKRFVQLNSDGSINSKRAWSDVNSTLIGNSAQSSWDGLSNSNSIISQSGHTSSAASVCLNSSNTGKNDWYLPSIDELSLLWNNRYNVNKTLSSGSSFGAMTASSVLEIKVGTASIGFWSSTENSSSDAYTMYFENGLIQQSSKGGSQNVRAIRRFSI